ncbi:MAG: hypothetical protein IKU00_04210 [Bacteroidales bacterium]|nr:hypothetical protein [Bacteroidales bacterium]
MKKASLFLIALCLLCLSCEKTPVNEWDRFYGFTKDDIVGHYEANPDESLYQELPTQGVTVYSNATIDITSLSGNSISIRIVIPSVINKVFSGAVNNEENSSDLVLRNFNEDIMMTVYKNSKGQIRMHGRVKRYRYDSDGILIDSNYYGFDVIKSTEN